MQNLKNNNIKNEKLIIQNRELTEKYDNLYNDFLQIQNVLESTNKIKNDNEKDIGLLKKQINN